MEHARPTLNDPTISNEEARFEVLTETECRTLLEEHEIGRVAVVLDDQPEIFPVNYVYKNDQLAFRTDPGTKLIGSSLRRVAFEIDSFDSASHSAWSVVVQGVGNDVTTALDEPIRDEPLEPWAGGAKDRWVRILPTSITGRRIVPLNA